MFDGVLWWLCYQLSGRAPFYLRYSGWTHSYFFGVYLNRTCIHLIRWRLP